MAQLQKINVKITNYKKQGSKWIVDDTVNYTMNEERVNNIIGAKTFFTNLGGYERHDKAYTAYGYRVVRVTSINPNKDYKSVYEFDFDNAE